MPTLELTIPPPIVALVAAVTMGGIARMAPASDGPVLVCAMAAMAIALVGVGVSLAGVLAFRRARTTVNPMKPQATTALVTSGIYTVTRNPMYVGVLLVLVAWAVFLSSPWALVGPVAFVLYINRFQIAPEERVLSGLFGRTYSDYRARVRRWL
jgi:protein-S-isoprenylcysteine O-methyltransferase Ste14